MDDNIMTVNYPWKRKKNSLEHKKLNIIHVQLWDKCVNFTSKYNLEHNIRLISSLIWEQNYTSQGIKDLNVNK